MSLFTISVTIPIWSRQDQPGYDVQEVIDGKLDIAAAWGPFAGYYKAVKHAPLTIQPVNLMEDDMPMEFDMALAVRTTDHDLLVKLEQAMHDQRDGDSRDPDRFWRAAGAMRYLPDQRRFALARAVQAGTVDPEPSGHEKQSVTIAMLNDWLAHGANVNAELNNAVIADDLVRVAYLLDKKHASIDAQDLQGETPLHHALVRRLDRW